MKIFQKKMKMLQKEIIMIQKKQELMLKNVENNVFEFIEQITIKKNIEHLKPDAKALHNAKVNMKTFTFVDWKYKSINKKKRSMFNKTRR